MAIQTAPSTITVATGIGNTVLALHELRDDFIEYRSTSIDGSTSTGIAAMRLTLTRQRPTAQSGRFKWKGVLTYPVLDLMGAVISTGVDVFERTIPIAFQDGTRESVLRKTSIGILQDTALAAALDTGSGFR